MVDKKHMEDIMNSELEGLTNKQENLEIFDYNYIPRDVYYRDEAQHILRSMIRFDKTGLVDNTFYHGSRGSGKTITFKTIHDLIINNDKVSTPIIYINCRTVGTGFRVLQQVLGERCVGLGFNDIIDRIAKKYKKIILILDEVDLLSNKERSKDLLYILSRAEKTKFLLFLLSNNINYYEKIDHAARSSLQLKRFYFKTYTQEELSAILQMRAKEGKLSIPDAYLRHLAALTVSEANGDCRVAIKCMQLSYEAKAFDQQQTPDPSDHFVQAREDIYKELIMCQEEQVILILQASVLVEEPLVRNIFNTYDALAKINGFKTLSYPTFLNNLYYLQSLGVILLVDAKIGRAWTQKLELLCSDPIIKTIYKQRGLTGANQQDLLQYSS